MKKTDFVEIQVSRDTKFLTLAEFPRMIAAALHPVDPLDEAEQQAIYVKRSVRNGALKTYDAAMNPCAPLEAMAPTARILIGDLMRYLENNVPSVRLRFYDAAGAAPANREAKANGECSATVGNERHAWQEDQIMRSIKALDFQPLSLPRDDRSNNVYVKSLVRARCGKIHGIRMRASIFDQAWERMLANHTLSFVTQT